MQNFDFHEGRGLRSPMPAFDRAEPDYYSRGSKLSYSREYEKKRKKTSRALFFFIAMNIITFTLGIATGIKFAGGPERVIVDPHTYQTVGDISRKVTSMIKQPSINTAQPANRVFPKEEYPFVIKIGDRYSSENARAIANNLSDKGHTVILSQTGEQYEVYAGPYRTKAEADKMRDEITGYRDSTVGSRVNVITR